MVVLDHKLQFEEADMNKVVYELIESIRHKLDVFGKTQKHSFEADEKMLKALIREFNKAIKVLNVDCAQALIFLKRDIQNVVNDIDNIELNSQWNEVVDVFDNQITYLSKLQNKKERDQKAFDTLRNKLSLRRQMIATAYCCREEEGAHGTSAAQKQKPLRGNLTKPYPEMSLESIKKRVEDKTIVLSEDEACALVKVALYNEKIALACTFLELFPKSRQAEDITTEYFSRTNQHWLILGVSVTGYVYSASKKTFVQDVLLA